MGFWNENFAKFRLVWQNRVTFGRTYNMSSVQEPMNPPKQMELVDL